MFAKDIENELTKCYNFTSSDKLVILYNYALQSLFMYFVYVSKLMP